jgi:hypothetical protein
MREPKQASGSASLVSSSKRRSSSLASYSSVLEEETDWVLLTRDATEAIKAAANSKLTEEAVPMYDESDPPLIDLTPSSTPPGSPV